MRIVCCLVLLLGCATTRVSQPPPDEIAAQEAAAEAAHRAAWLEANTDVLRQLAARAEGLATSRDGLIETTRSWRVGVDVLFDAAALCGSLLSEFEALAESLSGHLDEFGGDALPGLPEGWADREAVGTQRRLLGNRCEALPELITTAEKALAVEAEATAAREQLDRSKRTRKAADAVDEADRVLRDVVTDAVFVAYLDALDAWQVAATSALRESKRRTVEEAKLAEAREGEQAAKAEVGVLNATITLAISGRSGEVSDAISAAVKAMKRLKTDDRAAVLTLFPPEVTPASTVLLQLIGDRL